MSGVLPEPTDTVTGPAHPGSSPGLSVPEQPSANTRNAAVTVGPSWHGEKMGREATARHE